MARNVRNVWLSFSVDGRGSAALEGGPQARDGGFFGRVLLRQNGNIGDSVRIAAQPYEKGERSGQMWMDIEIPASCTVESTPDSDGVTRRMRLSWKL